MNSMLVTIIPQNSLPLALTFWFGITSVSLGHAQEISTLNEIPNTGVNITQEFSGETKANAKIISARFVTPTERRGLSQTFTWNVESPLTGIGVKIAPDEKKRFSTPQNYIVDVQELTDTHSDRSVKATIASVPFLLTPDSVVTDAYLYLRFLKPLSLEKGRAYGFHLRPMEVNPKNWLFVFINGEDAGGHPGYSGGVGSHTPGEFYKEGDRYGKEPVGRRLDLTFFTTTAAATN